MANRVIEYIVKAKDSSAGILGKVGGQLSDLAKKYTGMGGAALAAAAVVVAAVGTMVVKMAAFVSEMANVGDEFDKMSARTSISVESLGEWVFLMERAGGNASSFEGAIRRLTKSMVDNERGLSTAVEAWDTIGVSVSDAEGNLRSVDDVLLDLSDALSNMDNQTQRLGVSQDILGRGAAQMVVLLAQGRPELERQLDLYKSLNGDVREEFTKGAAAIIDAKTDLDTSIRGLKSGLAEPFQPEIATAIDVVALAIGGFSNVVKVVNDEIRSANNDGLFKTYTADLTALGQAAMIITDADIALIEALALANNKYAEQEAVIGDLTRAYEKLIDANDEFGKLDPLTKNFEAADFEPGKLEDILERIGILQREYDQAIQSSLIGMEELFDPGLSEDALSALEDYRRQMELIEETASNLVENLQGMLASSIFQVMSGEAVEFGRIIRDVVLKALSEMIAKLAIIATLNFITGGIAGAVSGAVRGGGGAPSGGFAVPGGVGGFGPLPGVSGSMKSTGASDMSKAFLNGSAISPFELGAGSDKELHLHMDIGRPVGRLDTLSLGEDLVTAAEFVRDGEL